MKSILKILVVLLAAVTTACSSDDTPKKIIEVPDSHRMIEFIIPYKWDIDDTRDIRVNLTRVATNHTSDFNAKCCKANNSLRIYLFINEAETIADGTYVLKTSLGGAQWMQRFIVEFQNEKLVSVSTSDYYKDLKEGSGTADNPYIIRDNTDLNMLLYGLSQDASHANGLYFKQEADINWERMEINANRGMSSEIFGGIYDGGEHGIYDISYTGSNDASKDSNVGLFKELSAGATIKNLSINMHISYATDNVGIIAGLANGNNTLENITISGSINQCGSNVGGLIGAATGSITINNCNTNLSINASGDCIGGAVGLSSDYLKIDGFYTVNTKANFSIMGGNYVGGVIGKKEGKYYEIYDINLNHSADAENSSVIGVQGKGDYVGGVMGYLFNPDTGNSFINNCKIVLSVKSSEGSYVGGAFGKIDTSGSNNTITFKGFTITSNVSGNSYIGGLIGEGVFTNASPIFQDITITSGFSDGKVDGANYTGGLFGRFSASKNITISPSDVSIDVNVSASGENAGGLAGYLTDSNINISDVTIGNGTMLVCAATKAGGIAGELNNSTLSGKNVVGFSSQSTRTIQPVNNFSLNYAGYVRQTSGDTQYAYIGGAIGNSVNSSTKGVYVKATVEAHGIYTGGLFGYLTMSNDIQVSDCVSNSIVAGSDYSGGIVGEISGRGAIVDCINYGEKVSGNNNVGGVAGKVYYKIDEPYINYCVNAAEVAGCLQVGGVVGLMSSDDKDVDASCKIYNSANYGKVTSTGDDHSCGTGGILGNCPTIYGVIQYCVNYGEVYAENCNCVGGISGTMGKDAELMSSYAPLNMNILQCGNYGKIWSADNDSSIGGIIGYQEEGYDNESLQYVSLVENCYNCGEIPSDHDHDTGGIIGYIDRFASAFRCVNYGNVKHGNGTIGTHKGVSTSNYNYTYLYTLEGTYEGDLWPSKVNVFSSSDMGRESTYNGFDFNSVWIMKDGKALLQKCPFQGVTYTK